MMALIYLLSTLVILSVASNNKNSQTLEPGTHSTPYWNLPWGRHPQHHMQITIVIINDSPHEFKVCYEKDWCANVLVNENITIKTSTTYLFLLSSTQWEGNRYLRVYPGKHIYGLSDTKETDIMYHDTEKNDLADINYNINNNNNYVRVVSTELTLNPPRKPWLEELWRDAIRTVSYNNNYSLCLCGAGNESTLYSIENPNYNIPLLVDPNTCGCGNPSNNYNFLLPCNHDYDTPMMDMNFLTNCLSMKNIEKKEEIRIHSIDSLNARDNLLCQKNRLWESIKKTYGREQAHFIMPNSYDFSNYVDRREFMYRTRMELSEGTVSIYIVKNPAKHRQKGLGLALGTDLMKISSKQKQQQTQQEKNFITDYIGDPFLFKGHKINLRQYLLLVCINGRLRAYAHDNSKVFYAKRPFVEPYISEEDEVTWNNNNILMEKQTDAIFTTGYLDDSFYNDKPMTVTELWNIFKEQKIDYTSLLKSMHLRLALAINSINSNVSVGDSTYQTNACTLSAKQTPECMKDAIRSVHLGCDFHVDKELTGFNSRLFECNRGPDLSSHNIRDGRMKLEVVTDIVSFLGLRGPFDEGEERLKKFKLTKIYDSYTFDQKEAFEYLESRRSNSESNSDIDQDSVHNEL